MAQLFISSDWGTSRFRLRAVRLPAVEIAAEFTSDQGVGVLAGDSPGTARENRFRVALEQALGTLSQNCPEPLAGAPIVISGMASSSIGWRELPYARLPLALDGRGFTWCELPSIAGPAGTHTVILLSGASTETDVMRGEETEALGVYQLPAGRDWLDRSLLVMPGTHSKHLEIVTGQISTFRTFMTGELFDMLSNHSILRHSTHIEESTSAPGDVDHDDHFRRGVVASQNRPLSAALFRVRTRQLLDQFPPQANRAFLSGLLIASELAYLTVPGVFPGKADDWPIVLCALGSLGESYRIAFDTLGLGERLRIVPNDDARRATALGQAALLKNLPSVVV